MIYKKQLKERQELGNYCDSSIIIKVVNNSNTTYLYIRRLRFREILKLIKRY